MQEWYWNSIFGDHLYRAQYPKCSLISSQIQILIPKQVHLCEATPYKASSTSCSQIELRVGNVSRPVSFETKPAHNPCESSVQVTFSPYSLSTWTRLRHPRLMFRTTGLCNISILTDQIVLKQEFCRTQEALSTYNMLSSGIKNPDNQLILYCSDVLATLL